MTKMILSPSTKRALDLTVTTTQLLPFIMSLVRVANLLHSWEDGKADLVVPIHWLSTLHLSILEWVIEQQLTSLPIMDTDR